MELQIEFKIKLNKFGAKHVKDYPLINQFTREAFGLNRQSQYFTIEEYDDVLKAAGKHGYGFLTEDPNYV
jgi:hypothetical protein